MSKDFIKAVYEFHGYFNEDAELMEKAIRVENLFSLIRENKIQKFQSEIKKSPKALYSTNNLRQTALHIACQYDRPEILSFLLERLPKDTKSEDRFINKRDIDGFTPLMVCADRNRTECAKILMPYKPDLTIVGYDLKRNVAHLAAQKNSVEILRLVLSATANRKKILNINEPCTDRECREYTPAHFAASNFADKAIEVLKELGADINACAHYKTPLMIAFQSGSQAVASYLLDQPEIDLTLRDSSGHLAYHYARHFRAPTSTVKQIRYMTEEQFKEKYPKIVSKQELKALISKEHTKE